MKHQPQRITSLAATLAVAVLLSTPSHLAFGATDAASAFPADTLIYMEVSDVAHDIELLAETRVWEAVADSLATLPAVQRTGADTTLADLSRLMLSVRDDPALRHRISDLLGGRVVVGVMPDPGVVVAFELDAMNRRLDALSSTLEHHLGLSFNLQPNGEITIGRGSGAPLLTGRQVSGWLVVGSPPVRSETDAVAQALAAESTFPGPSLSDLEHFRTALCHLPRQGAVHGFVNTDRIADQLDAWRGQGSSEVRLASFLLRQAAGVGFSREVTEGSISLSLSACPPFALRGQLALSLADAFGTRQHPLSPRLPSGALLTYDASFSPDLAAKSTAALLREVMPALHTGISRVARVFDHLDPVLEILPRLQHGFAAAVLTGEEGEDRWPLPRPVLVLRVDDQTAVEQPLADLLTAKAGAVAALTEGLVGASVVSELHEGVELHGLLLESVFPALTPLPSPTYAVVDGLLVLSPTRSAVRETVSSIHRTDGEHTSPAFEASPRVVEWFHLDLAALGDEMPRAQRLLDDDSSLHPVIRALSRVLHSLGPVWGQTVVAEDNVLEITIEIGLRPQEDAR